MNASRWPDFLDDPRKIYDLYDKEPDLNACDLFYLLVDERETSITLGFETPHMPQHTQADTKEKNLNSFEFFLTFFQVQRLSIRGWEGPAHRSVTILRDPDNEIALTVRSAGTDMAFQAKSVSLVKWRMGLVSRSE